MSSEEDNNAEDGEQGNDFFSNNNVIKFFASPGHSDNDSDGEENVGNFGQTFDDKNISPIDSATSTSGTGDFIYYIY